MPARRSVVLLASLGAAVAGVQIGLVETSLAAPGSAGASATSPTAGATPATAGTAARNLVTMSIAAAKAKGSVHYVERAAAGKQSLSVVGDVSANKGQQTVTIRDGSATGHVVGRWSGHKVYFRADATGLSYYLGMSNALARKYAQRWIVFSPADVNFAQTASQFTVAGPVAEIILTGRLSVLGTSTVDGSTVVTVKGRTTALSSAGRSGTGTLYLAADGTALPVRFVARGNHASRGSTGQIDFSRWGETVNVRAPSRAVPAAAVR